MKRFQR